VIPEGLEQWDLPGSQRSSQQCVDSILGILSLINRWILMVLGWHCPEEALLVLVVLIATSGREDIGGIILVDNLFGKER